MTIQHSPFFPSPRFVVSSPDVHRHDATPSLEEALARVGESGTSRIERVPAVPVESAAPPHVAPHPRESVNTASEQAASRQESEIPWNWRRAIARVLGMTALLGFAATGIHGAGAEGVRAFEGSAVRLPCIAVIATAFKEDDPSAHGVSLPIEEGGATALIPRDFTSPSIVRAYADAVDARGQPVPALSFTVSAVSQSWALVAFVSASLLLFSLFGLFSPPGRAAGGIGTVLSGSDGRLSVGRTQLFVWVLTLFGVLAASSLPLGTWPVFDRTLLGLLGISVLTAAGGAAASRPADGAGSTSAGWAFSLQLARVQCIAVTGLGALAVLASFAANMRLSPIPTTGILLVAASHALYVAAKAAYRVAAR